MNRGIGAMHDPHGRALTLPPLLHLLPDHVDHDPACLSCLLLADEPSRHGDRGAVILRSQMLNNPRSRVFLERRAASLP